MTKFKIAAAAAILIAASVQARADDTPKRDWQLLSFEDGKCHTAATSLPKYPTPEAFHQELRDDGIIDTVKVTKDHDGNVAEVLIYANTKQGKVVWLWIVSKPLCELARSVLKDKGDITDSDDLK